MPEPLSHEEMVAKHAEGEEGYIPFGEKDPVSSQGSAEPKPAEAEEVDLGEYADQLTPDRPVGKIPEHHEEIVVSASEPQGGDVEDLEAYRQQIAADKGPRVVELPERETVNSPIGTEEAFQRYADERDDEKEARSEETTARLEKTIADDEARKQKSPLVRWWRDITGKE